MGQSIIKLNTCIRCGSREMKIEKTGGRRGAQERFKFVCECGRRCKSQKTLADAVVEWNEMNSL